MKVDDRFQVHNMTIPTNQMFTKMNLNQTVSNVNNTLNNQHAMAFPPNIQAIIASTQEEIQFLQQHQLDLQQKEMNKERFQPLNEHASSFPFTDKDKQQPPTMSQNEDDISRSNSNTPQPSFLAAPQQKRRGSKHSDNGGGQLEVASALLSICLLYTSPSPRDS